MEQELDNAVSRIKKLLAYAGDKSASPGEIENALGHATRLMQKFNLEQKDIVLDADKRQKAFEQISTHDGYSRAGRIDAFDIHMVQVCKIVCDVDAYTSTKYDSGKERQHLIFVGFAADCQIAIAMYHELLATMRALIKVRFPDTWRKNQKAYCTGFVQGLIDKAKRFKDSIAAEAGTTSIVLAKDKLVQEWIEKNLNLSFRKNRRGKMKFGSAFMSGASDGASVDLGGITGKRPPTARKYIS